MYTRALNSGLILIVLTMTVALFGLAGCNSVDIKLVNQIKTFEPRWSTLGEELNWVDQNLDLMEGQFEKDYQYLEPLFDQIPDSLNGPHFRNLKKQYPKLIISRDEIRETYTDSKAEYRGLVSEFNEWEQRVMSGDVKSEIAYAELKDYKKQHKDMMNFTIEARESMASLVKEHNTILRELAEMVSTPTNLDMKLKI